MPDAIGPEPAGPSPRGSPTPDGRASDTPDHQDPQAPRYTVVVRAEVGRSAFTPIDGPLPPAPPPAPAPPPDPEFLRLLLQPPPKTAGEKWRDWRADALRRLRQAVRPAAILRGLVYTVGFVALCVAAAAAPSVTLPDRSFVVFAAACSYLVAFVLLRLLSYDELNHSPNSFRVITGGRGGGFNPTDRESSELADGPGVWRLTVLAGRKGWVAVATGVVCLAPFAARAEGDVPPAVVGALTALTLPGLILFTYWLDTLVFPLVSRVGAAQDGEQAGVLLGVGAWAFFAVVQPACAAAVCVAYLRDPAELESWRGLHSVAAGVFLLLLAAVALVAVGTGGDLSDRWRGRGRSR